MIRVNLLGERRTFKKKLLTFQLAQKLTVGCSLILLGTGLFIGWRYWSLTKTSAQIDVDLASAQKETTRLHSIIAQVQQFEQRKAQLQQRVQLIEQLRKDQTGPVHMLDQISKALPPMLWLTQLKQTPGGADVLIEGRCTSLTGLSDFVSNLEATGYFQRSVEIVSSTADNTPTGELVKFQVKAVFKTPGDGKDAKAAAAAAPAARSGV